MTAILIYASLLAFFALINLSLGDYTRAALVGLAALLMGYWDCHRKRKLLRRINKPAQGE